MTRAMLEITSASAQSAAAPAAAPLSAARGAAHSYRGGGRCRGGRADGVQPNWWNAAAPAAPSAAQPQSGGIMGALQSLIGAFGGALQGGIQQFLGAPAPSAPGSMRVSEVSERNS